MTLRASLGHVMWLMIVSECCASAEPATTFTHLGAEHGLPAQTVWSMAQDARGFIWFATSAGVARYDGIEMRVYRHDPLDPRSLVDDGVNALLVDSRGTLWVGTSGGLARFDPATDSFDRFVHDPADAGTLASDDVTSIAEGPDGTLWLGAGGLNRLDPATGRVSRFVHSPDDATSLPAGYVLAVHVGRLGRVWVGTYGGGLSRLNPASGEFETVEIGPLDTSDRNELHDIVRVVYTDSRDNVWVGTDGGLNRLLPTGAREFYEYNYEDAADPRGLSSNYANAVFEDSQGGVWVGTADAGLNRYNAALDQFERFPVDPANARSPTSNLVTSIIEDRTGLLWFGGRGVDRLDLTSELFEFHAPPAGNPAETIAAYRSDLPLMPGSLFVDGDGVVWIGNSMGLATLDPATDSWRAHWLVPDNPDFPDNSVYTIHDGADGWVYVGVPQSIALFLRARDGFGPSLISLRGTPNVIHVDRGGVIWAAMPNVGLARLPGRNGEDQEYFESDASDASSLSSDFIFFIHEDDDGALWLGSLDGLNRFDPGTGRVVRFGYQGANGAGPSDPEIRDVAPAPDGSLWLATGHGVNRFDPSTGRFEYFDVEDGLAHDRVNAVMFDTQGYLWAGTEAGLSRLNPSSGEIRSFYVQHGLPSDEVQRLSLAPDGELYIATHDGLVSVRPETIVNAGIDPEIGVAGVNLVNASDPPGGNPDVRIAAALGGSGLTLSHRDRVVTFDLAVFDYRDPERNRYAYRLEGFDTDWSYTRGAQRNVTYTTLPPGDYRFRFRGADSTGRWTELGQEIPLTVLPAPWRSSWAYALYAIAVVLAFFGFAAVRTRSATQRAHQLELAVHERTRELRNQRDTIERQSETLRELASTKDELFANVSHEFRTPLSVILGPVDRLLQREHQSERRAQLETIRSNANRLLRLVDQLMDLARLDAARLADPRPQPLGQRVQSLVETFGWLAEDHEIALTADCDDSVWASCDEDALDKIVVNLISNAIKYNRPEGEVHVSVGQSKEGSAQIEVTDTGIGIPPAEQDRIFERFYRLGEGAETASGSGLGLALVKELVTANRGTIELTSRPGVGTTFRALLPRVVPPAEGTSVRPVSSEAPALEIAVLAASQSRQVAGSLPVDRAVQPRGSLRRALIIEDSVDLCRHIGSLLADDFACEFAHDGQEGLRVGLESIPDVIVCDVMLPRLNGFEIVRQLKEDDRTCHIPVILLTARADEESRITGLKTLADDYLTKPFSDAELQQRIENLLAVRELLRERFGRRIDGSSDQDPAFDVLGERDRRFIDRVDSVLAEHAAKPEFSLGEFANLLAMSERQLQRKLKALTDRTPREYLRNFRLDRASRLLKSGERVGDVAFRVGFTSQAYFASCFKARFGITPSQQRAGSSRSRG